MRHHHRPVASANACARSHAHTHEQLSSKARSVVRTLDATVRALAVRRVACNRAHVCVCVAAVPSQNDLTFLRVRSKKHEIMVAPDKDYLLIVIQNPNADEKRL